MRVCTTFQSLCLEFEALALSRPGIGVGVVIFGVPIFGSCYYFAFRGSMDEMLLHGARDDRKSDFPTQITQSRLSRLHRFPQGSWMYLCTPLAQLANKCKPPRLTGA